jgi:alkanesulfonate monooxygenase SsuD/methylene tetrahydromethanopterin reductase-like flavin-dependent oxidoreductase (luciferase family)
MRFGVHLPVLGWDQRPMTLDRLSEVARAAERLGLDTLSVNDHLVYRSPWLDGPMALAAVLATVPTMTLMTSVALPVVRGPVSLAKSLAAIDLLSGGRLVAGVGPGSSAADYDAVGVPFTERWPRATRERRAPGDRTVTGCRNHGDRGGGEYRTARRWSQGG